MSEPIYRPQNTQSLSSLLRPLIQRELNLLSPYQLWLYPNQIEPKAVRPRPKTYPRRQYTAKAVEAKTWDIGTFRSTRDMTERSMKSMFIAHLTVDIRTHGYWLFVTFLYKKILKSVRFGVVCELNRMRQTHEKKSLSITALWAEIWHFNQNVRFSFWFFFGVLL